MAFYWHTLHPCLPRLPTRAAVFAGPLSTSTRRLTACARRFSSLLPWHWVCLTAYARQDLLEGAGRRGGWLHVARVAGRRCVGEPTTSTQSVNGLITHAHIAHDLHGMHHGWSYEYILSCERDCRTPFHRACPLLRGQLVRPSRRSMQTTRFVDVCDDDLAILHA